MSGRETEVKFAIESPGAFRKKLAALGFRVSRRKIFERNAILDMTPLRLRPEGCLLRIREAGGRTIVTFKGKASVGRVKSREEIEFEASDADAVQRVFAGMGYESKFVYEKYRTEYQRPGEAGVVTLDITPIGVYAEVEGEEDWIDGVAAGLGFVEADYITASYGALYLQWCERSGARPGDMRFEDK